MNEHSEPAPVTAPLSTPARVRGTAYAAIHRLRESVPAIVQIVVAASAAYAFAHFVLGHAAPLLAATVTVSSLGLVRDARPRRVLETVIGMLVGIVIAELIYLVAGAEWWQLAIALAATLAVGRLISAQPGFAISAGIQSIIVMVIATGAPFIRLLDGVIGGIAALLVTVLIPRNATRGEIRDGRALFAAFEDAARAVVQALHRGDRMRAERGLEKARALQPAVENWRASVETGIAVARISPLLHRQRFELQRHRRILQSMDFATRNLRVIARRVVYLTDDRTAHPALADALGELVRAGALVGDTLDDLALEPAAREALLALASRLDPQTLLADATFGEQNLVAALRPLAVDFLTATGMTAADARAAIPRV
ncbi:FUSC family protein [Microbacterium sp. 18062]|uniref:FUSC family protein n=1 Tax=Microbacterium sp. 18062 TaxID=2681410 RepID=UPI001F43F88E|nr:FUSC family protein [Microbacterium sp. 18062]